MKELQLEKVCSVKFSHVRFQTGLQQSIICCSFKNGLISLSWFLSIILFILLAEKFLKSDWLRQAVFQPNMKHLHVQITVAVATGGTALLCC